LHNAAADERGSVCMCDAHSIVRQARKRAL